MTINPALVAEYFTSEPDTSKTQYFTLGAKPPEIGSVGLDSSDQDILCFDAVSGIVAYRNGIVMVDRQNTGTHCSISEIVLVSVLPTLPRESGLRLKLAMEQLRRFKVSYRPAYSPLQKPWPLMRPRLIGAAEREVEDYNNTRLFLCSAYARPGLLFMRDGRLNAQSFPGARAYDLLYRHMTSRFVRSIGIAKSGNVLDVVRPYARVIRKRVDDSPFAFPVFKEHLEAAHPGPRSNAGLRKTLRHGSSGQALGGVGAVRFALSVSGDELCLIEFNLYDLEHFHPLVISGHTLEQWAQEIYGPDKRAIYSWDILPFVTARDFEQLIVPTLEEVVYAAYTDTEIGLYPRALANVHDRVKLRRPDVESSRRQVIVDLGWQGVPPEMIPEFLADPHKTDPDIYNLVVDR
jgi:hypothetical protein